MLYIFSSLMYLFMYLNFQQKSSFNLISTILTFDSQLSTFCWFPYSYNILYFYKLKLITVLSTALYNVLSQWVHCSHFTLCYHKNKCIVWRVQIKLTLAWICKEHLPNWAHFVRFTKTQIHFIYGKN